MRAGLCGVACPEVGVTLPIITHHPSPIIYQPSSPTIIHHSSLSLSLSPSQASCTGRETAPWRHDLRRQPHRRGHSGRARRARRPDREGPLAGGWVKGLECAACFLVGSLSCRRPSLSHLTSPFPTPRPHPLLFAVASPDLSRHRRAGRRPRRHGAH